MAKKDNKTKKQENNKNKKSFFKDFKAELKKVIWPTPKQLINNTIAVITIVLITAVIVFVLDLVFETINTQGVNRIKEVITTNSETTQNSTTDENTDNTSSDENQTVENNTNTEETNDTENNTTAEE